MDSIPFAKDVMLVLDKLETTVNKIFECRDISQDNVQTLRRVDQLHRDATEQLKRLACSPGTDSVLAKRLGHFETLLRQNVEKLETWQTNVEEATVRSRVRRMKQILDKCEADATSFFQFLIDHVCPSVKEEENVLPAKYIPDNNVPRNPPRLTQDYSNSDSCEGKLKAAVLDQSSTRVIAVVASGKGGVGKTCALRGLATDPDIRNRFPGGILYIQLANDSNLSNVIQGIARIIRRTGDASLARRVANVRHLQDASDEASVWFRPYACLLLIDDIWWENGIDIEVLNILCTMLNDDSRVVLTSRDRRFLKGSDTEIEFSETEARGELARRMLMTHAGYDEKALLDEANNTALEAILDMCQGLPLALGIAGASLRNYLRMRCEEEKQNAWSDFYEDMMLRRNDLFDALDVSSGKDKLPKIVDISLEALENRKDGRSYQKLFRAFCVVRKQQIAPIHMLQSLWDMEEIREAEQVVDCFSIVSLLQVRREDGCIWIQLHDLILGIATRRAAQEYEIQQFFRTLVHNYVPKEEREIVPQAERESEEQPEARTGICKGLCAKPILKRLCCFTSESNEIVQSESTRVSPVSPSLCRAWWDSEDDGYVYDNLCRALANAGHADELIWLLSKPQWIVKRLQTSGIYGVQEDIEHGIVVVRCKDTNESSLLKHLDMVEKAARMSCTFVKDNPYEAWFQLYGRLVWYAKYCNRTQSFVDEIERCAPRPWARPSEGFLQPAAGAGIDLIYCLCPVLCVSEDNGCVVFFWRAGSTEAGIIQYNPKTDTRHTQELKILREGNYGWPMCAEFSRDTKRLAIGYSGGRIVIWDRETESMTKILEGHTCVVWCVAFSADGNRVVSGSVDGTVQLWDALSGEAVGQPLIGHLGIVCSVALSADGSRVVSGSTDGTVRLWDALSGEAVGQPIFVHPEGVRAVASSADGSEVVSGSCDGTIRLWNARSGEAVGQPLVGHTDHVLIVGLNADGSRIMSASDDGSVRLWNVLNGEAEGQPLFGHTDSVRCVAFNKDESQVVSGSDDCTVRLWNVLSGETVRQPLVGHPDSAFCVAFNTDRSQMVSGMKDSTVRLWDALTGEALGRPLVGHTDYVTSVAFSTDGSRVVSGSVDSTVRLWDALSGEAVGRPLIGHAVAVCCVAFSADGNRVVSGSVDSTILLWNVMSEETVGQPLVGHTDAVSCVAFSADGSRVVSGSFDRTVRLWDVLSGKAVGYVLFHQHPVRQIGVDAQCSRVVSFESVSGVGRLWNVRPRACVVTSELTSLDVGWQSAIDALALTWSTFEPVIRRITERGADGTEIVTLATSDGELDRLGDRWCTRASGFSEFCEIVR